MTDCIFCKIAHHEVNSRIVFENDRVVAFHDLFPAAPTHLLIIPKQHFTTLNDVPASEAALLAWGDSEPAPLRWSEIVPLSLLGLNTSALDAPAVVVISLALRRLTDAAGMVPELLALGGSLRRVLDAPGAPRAWL